MAEQERLKKEIEYYSALIQQHESKQTSHSAFNHNHTNVRKGNPINRSRYSLVRNNQPTVQLSASSHKKVTSNRTVVPPQNAPSRTVILSGSHQPSTLTSSRRTVLKPSPSLVKHLQSTIKHSQSAVKHSQSAVKHSQAAIKRSQSAVKELQSTVKLLQPVIKPTQSSVQLSSTAAQRQVTTIMPSKQHKDSNRRVQSLSSVHPNTQISSSEKHSDIINKVNINASDKAEATHSQPSPSETESKTFTSNTNLQKRKIVVSKNIRSQSANGNSKFIWVNSKIFGSAATTSATSSQAFSSKNEDKTDSSVQANVRKLDSDYTYKSKYKLSKVTSSNSTQLRLSSSTGKSRKGLTAVGKYKLVTKTSRSATKARIPNHLLNSSKRSPYLSKSGKRIISRYAIRRQSLENRYLRRNPTSFGASPRLKKAKMTSPYKIDRRKNVVALSRYKIDKLRSTRKPSQRISSAKRTPDRRSMRWVRSELKNSYKTFVSPYKLFRRSLSLRDNASGRQNTLSSMDKNWVVRQIASRSLHKSVAVSIRAKYKKNNTNDKQCLFYMRFGKCNRGDKCFYIHDADRIAVCTRYLRGTCTIENCPFSHEAKKEKVPVCQHFLRGCCLRDNCPYLHVNVGKDAPICKSFAEHRYCHLGEKCKKLHTDICPNRDEDGKCTKGNKCKLRHPKRIMKRSARVRYTTQDNADTSADDPVVDDQIIVPHGEKFTKALPVFISLTKTKVTDTDMTQPREVKVLKTKPNFL